MEKRRQPRSKRRFTCELVIGSQRYPAIVRDVSPAGLFVQTRAKPEPDTVVELVLPEEDGQPEMRVEAGVARHRMVPSRLRSMVPDGIGLELLDASPAIRERLLGRATDSEAPAPFEGGQGRAASPGIRTFRVKLRQRGRPKARVLTIRSESVAAARARALTRAGRGWSIADIQEI